jgi:benzoyl-CoA reductase/2-hydroxyglutaryl-CoA dehydratase subunit BcrC/BadD/HgdB
MQPFDHRYREALSERSLKLTIAAKENGAKVVAVYCAFTPKEIIAAAGAIPVSLCAGSERPIAAAEQHLPRNICPLIKSSYGFALTDTCPYFHEADQILADLTCDGKKKMFELLGAIKPVHVLQLPQSADTEESVRQWSGEVEKILHLIQHITGKKATEDDLKQSIHRYNAFRRTVQRVFEVNTGAVPLVFGREAEAITDSGGFDIDLETRIREMETAVLELEKRAEDSAFMAEMQKRPRLLLTGCPTTNKKLLDIVEESGGVVAAMENCGGLKTAGMQVDTKKEPLTALAEAYLAVPCPCMTPNKGRMALLEKLISDYRIEGVLELTWQACHTYNIEAYSIQKFTEDRMGLPYLQVETDYSQSDTERIRVRVQAFLELLR